MEDHASFVGDHYPSIYRYLLYLTGRPEQAEDLTQETFIQAWRHRATFEGRGSLRAWLLGIARRAFLQALRRRLPEGFARRPALCRDPRGTRRRDLSTEWELPRNRNLRPPLRSSPVLELTFAYTRPIERGLRTHRACSRGNWGQDLTADPAASGV